MSENTLKTISKEAKPSKSAMLLFSAKKPSKSSLLNSDEKVLAGDSDESCDSFSENKENIRKNINFQHLDDSENNSSFLCKRSILHQSYENSNDSLKKLNKESPLSSSESDRNDTSICEGAFLLPKENKNSSCITPTSLTKGFSRKECDESYDSSFINDEKDSSVSEPSSVSSDEKEDDILLEGDILTPPAANIPKSERRVATKCKFVDYRKCVTDKKQKHNVLKEINTIKALSPIKKSTEKKSIRKRIVILSDSSEDEKETKILPDISSPVHSTPIMCTKDTGNDSSSSDSYGIEKIKASVRKTITQKEADNSLDRSSVAIHNESVENGKEYDDSFIDDSEGEESSSSSQSSYGSDDFSSEDLHQDEAENSFICNVNSANDTDDERSNDETKPRDFKRKTSTVKPITSKILAPKDGVKDDLDSNKKIGDLVDSVRNKTVQPIIKKPAIRHTKTFLSSLSMENWDDERQCHPDALRYIKQYSRHKKELAKRLYDLYNNEAFEGCLPTDMEIKWDSRLTKTAGTCSQAGKLDRKTGTYTERKSSINLSIKVLDSPDRLRDTLVHEMCHAASWMISGYRDGHGPIWKNWAARAMNRFPELPVIARCHSYEIRTKYVYRCQSCKTDYGRHSKSIDTSKKRCGRCRGQLELLVASKIGGKYKKSDAHNGNHKDSNNLLRTPKAPNAFAMFVKENYKTFRTPGTTHKNAMEALSLQFSQTKISKD